MRNANSPSGPGKPERDAVEKTNQREGIEEMLDDEDQLHSASSTDRQPNLNRPPQNEQRPGSGSR